MTRKCDGRADIRRARAALTKPLGRASIPLRGLGLLIASAAITLAGCGAGSDGHQTIAGAPADPGDRCVAALDQHDEGLGDAKSPAERF